MTSKTNVFVMTFTIGGKTAEEVIQAYSASKLYNVTMAKGVTMMVAGVAIENNHFTADQALILIQTDAQRNRETFTKFLKHNQEAKAMGLDSASARGFIQNMPQFIAACQPGTIRQVGPVAELPQEVQEQIER